MKLNGIINLNKPLGKTSFQMVSLVRRLTGERRVGHAGTLDPEATGVLPICLGQGTRVVEFLNLAQKVYQAEIELGTATTTYDATGEVTQRGDISSLKLGQIEEALSRFKGEIEQVPPPYSAVKHHGQPLYKLARAGAQVPQKPRKVQISRLEILHWEGAHLEVEVECGKGTYIRSLAHDLGQVLGCGAHLRKLTRLQSGPFRIEEAVSPEELEEAFRQGYWQTYLHPLDVALSHLDAVIVGESDRKAILNGRFIALADVGGELCRAYSSDGKLLAVLRFRPDRGLWHPEKVFAEGL